MKILDFFRRKKESNLGEFDIKNSLYYSKEQRMRIRIFGVKEETEVIHRNDYRTKLFLAKALKTGKEDAEVFESAENIAFEIPSYEEINGEILQAIALEYEKQQMQNSSKCKYLGITNWTEKGWQINQKSEYMERYINTQIVPRMKIEQERKRQENERILQKANQDKNLNERINAIQYIEQKQAIKKQRLQAPYLEKTDKYEINSKIYEDYNGVNIQNGEILKIRKLLKIGKDTQSNMYLYQGYIDSTFGLNDVEVLGNRPGEAKPSGVPICFELPERFSDIVISNNQQKILKLLGLLSNERNFQNPKTLTYIGGINKNGMVTHQSFSQYEAINTAVENLKQTYNQMQQGGEPRG